MKQTKNNQIIPRSSFLIFLLSLISIIAVVHILGLSFDIYEKFLRLDSILHFLGGLWVGLSAIWIFFVSEYIKPLKITKWKVLFISLLAAATVGIFWELFELWAGVPFYVEKYAADTIKDLILDVLGAFLGYVYIARRYLS